MTATLYVTAHSLVLEISGLHGQARSGSVRRLVRRLSNRSSAETAVVLAEPLNGSELSASLERLTERVRGHLNLEGLRLSVRVGGPHSKLGILSIEGVSADHLQAAVNAWVQQQLRLDPSQHVIRWEALSRKGRHVVICVPRIVYDTLTTWAHSCELAIESFKPAILDVLQTWKGTHRTSTAEILVWEEPGEAGRFEAVQMYVLDGREISHSWRAWIPSIHHPVDPLPGAIRRFAYANGVETAPIVKRMWNVPAQSRSA